MWRMKTSQNRKTPKTRPRLGNYKFEDRKMELAGPRNIVKKCACPLKVHPPIRGI